MATLERIRSKGVLLLIVIGIALLAFIVGDFLNNSSSWFRQSQENIAEINGETVKIQEYQALIDQLTEVYKVEYNLSTVDENAIIQIRQTVWENILKTNLLESEAAKIGLTVNQKELESLTIGDNPHQLVLGRRIFMNPQTGMFDKNRMISLIAGLDKKPANAQEQEQLTALKNYWMYFEQIIKIGKLEEKYNTLLAKAINANSIEAKMNFESSAQTVDYVYIVKPYGAIADEKAIITDKEIEAKYKETKTRYKQKNNREINYVAFNLVPSQNDFLKAENWITSLKESFTTTDDIASVVNPNSRPYRDIALSEKDIDPQLTDFAFSGNKNDVFGPVLFGNTYKMARIMATGISAPDSINLKHIVVMAENEEKTKTLADSILDAVNNGANFAMLAMQYSQMKETAMRGGEVGWVPIATADEKIIDACLAQPTNKYFTYTDGSAIQVIQVTEKTANRNKVKLAVIENQVNPSQETYSKIYNEAKQFAANHNTLAKFEKEAQAKGIVIIPAIGLEENTPSIGGLKNSRQIIKWAFDQETAGIVSDVYDCEDKFIVAAVSDVLEEGYQSLDKVKDVIKQTLIIDKKAALISKDIEAAKAKDIKTLAQKLALTIDTAIQVNFIGSSFGKAGYEPTVIAHAAKAKINELSTPIKGIQGVYAIQPYYIFTNPIIFDATREKAALTRQYSSITNGAYEALKEGLEIEDYRSNFY